MGKDVQERYVAITNDIVTKLPWLAVPNCAIAFFATSMGYQNSILLWTAAALTLAAGCLVLMRYQFGSRGMRSPEDLGFTRVRDCLRYAIGSRGYDRTLVFLLVGTLLAFCLVTEERDGRATFSGASALALASFWSVGVIAYFTRRWPADERSEQVE